MIRELLRINRWDLNLILTIIGFPFFTTLISNSVASIVYRGVALFVALYCLIKRGSHFAPTPAVRCFLFILLYVSIQSLIGVLFGEYANVSYSGMKYQFLLFNVGVVCVPLFAFVRGFDRIQWKKTLLWIFVLMLITIVKADLGTVDSEVDSSGRYDMGRLSTLAFGDNGAYLVLLSTALLATRKVWLNQWKGVIIGILIASILAGLFGVLKAGSRGPLVGCVAGILFLVYCMRGKDRTILITALIVLVLSGAVSLSKLENFAPAIVSRFRATVEDGDTSGRDVLFEEAIEKFEDHPVFGTNPMILTPTYMGSYHNVYLEILLGGGILVFVIFLYSLFAIVFASARVKRQLLLHPGFLFLFSLFFFNMARGISGIGLTTHPIYAFAFAGCGLALYRIKTSTDNRIRF